MTIREILCKLFCKKKLVTLPVRTSVEGKPLGDSGVASIVDDPSEYFYYGKTSQRYLSTCHSDLIRVGERALQIARALGFDLSVTEGHRGKVKQNRAFASGTSQVKWPDSEHNEKPSRAVHIMMYPVMWPQPKDATKKKVKMTGRFYMTASIVLYAAFLEDVPITWGGRWSNKGDIMDNNFDDLAHFELRKSHD